MKNLPRVRLYENRQKDKDILNWLDQIPSGLKTQAIKDAIWANIAQNRLLAPISAPAPPQNQDSISGHMRASVRFDTHELLADIRQIVEIGVASALGHHTAPTTGMPARFTSKEDENEIEEILDDLELSFMLDDEEEE